MITKDNLIENENKIAVIGVPDYNKTKLSEIIKQALSQNKEKNINIRGC
jgi:hypothetical protein